MKLLNVFVKGGYVNKAFKDYEPLYFARMPQRIILTLNKELEFEELLKERYPEGVHSLYLDYFLNGNMPEILKQLGYKSSHILEHSVYNDIDYTVYISHSLDALIEKIILDNPEFEYLSNKEDVEYMQEHNLKNVNEYIKHIMLNDKNSIFDLQRIENEEHKGCYVVKINY